MKMKERIIREAEKGLRGPYKRLGERQANTTSVVQRKVEEIHQMALIFIVNRRTRSYIKSERK